MKMRVIQALRTIVATVFVGVAASAAAAADKEVVVGILCDRTGPTQGNGVIMCGAAEDYFQLVNSKGGVEGYRIRPIEIDAEYKVPQGVEAYERWKKEGAVLIMLYGTAHVQSLQQRMAQDRIIGTSPGFGTSTSSDGTRFPYLFPIAATFYSQGAAAVKFISDKLGGLKGKKIAFLFLDNPTGREPLPMLEALSKQEGFELKQFPAPPPGLEMNAQVLDITQRYKPDFVITNLFSRSASVGMRTLSRANYPMDKAIGLVWAAPESDIEAAGGWAVADGYYVLAFHGLGADYPILQDVRDMYKADGKPLPKDFATTLYNRWLFHAAIQVEAIRNAAKVKKGAPITGEDLRAGFESISRASLARLGDMTPPLQVTPTDHEGGGWIQVYQVRNSKLNRVTDWFTAYRATEAELIKQQQK
jgi:branched-chain amino acid transport system substrate-binding protein